MTLILRGRNDGNDPKRLWIFTGMSEDPARFRNSARNCRELAAQARNEEARRELLEVAFELEREADQIEAAKEHSD